MVVAGRGGRSVTASRGGDSIGGKLALGGGGSDIGGMLVAASGVLVVTSGVLAAAGDAGKVVGGVLLLVLVGMGVCTTLTSLGGGRYRGEVLAVCLRKHYIVDVDNVSLYLR